MVPHTDFYILFPLLFYSAHLPMYLHVFLKILLKKLQDLHYTWGLR